MSKNDRKAALVLAVIKVFVDLTMKQRKQEFLEIVDELFLEYKRGVRNKDLRKIAKNLDAVYSRMIQSKYEVTPTFVLAFTSNFALEYLEYVKGNRKVTWQKLNDFVNDHPINKRILKSNSPDYTPFEESDEFVQFINEQIETV